MQTQEKLIGELPSIKLVKRAGRWVTQNGDRIILRLAVPGVQIITEHEVKLLVDVYPGGRLSRGTHSIVVNGATGDIITIRAHNPIAFKGENLEPWLDIEEFRLGVDHPLAGSFMVIKDIDHSTVGV